MAITLTWSAPGQTPKTWTLTPEALASLDAYRLTLLDMTQRTESDNTVTNVWAPKYGNVLQMIQGEFKRFLITPAFALNPPASIQTKKAALDAAQADLEAAQNAATNAVLG